MLHLPQSGQPEKWEDRLVWQNSPWRQKQLGGDVRCLRSQEAYEAWLLSEPSHFCLVGRRWPPLAGELDMKPMWLDLVYLRHSEPRHIFAIEPLKLLSVTSSVMDEWRDS